MAFDQDILGGVIFIEQVHHSIHHGEHYFVAGFESEDTSGTIEFVVTTPNSDLRAHMTFAVNSINILTMEVYEGSSSIVGGDAVTPINNDRNSAKTSGLTILKDPTSITAGTLIDSSKTGSDVGPAGKGAFGGEAVREKEMILKKNTTYLYRMTSGADSNVISYRGEWYETTKKYE